MDKIVKTFTGDKKSNSCLICGTTHYVGKPILPQPACKCGNISFFDITPHYVRIGINWPFLKVEDESNWQETVLKDIENNGHPNNIAEPPEEYKGFNDKFDFNNPYL